jgi:hypothetical protein
MVACTNSPPRKPSDSDRAGALYLPVSSRSAALREGGIACRRVDRLGATNSGPYSLPSARSSTAPATTANYPARSDSRGLPRSPTRSLTLARDSIPSQSNA